jgi:hypothetical protein
MDHVVRRLKSELLSRWDGTPRFPLRQSEATEMNYTNEENKYGYR